MERQRGDGQNLPNLPRMPPTRSMFLVLLLFLSGCVAGPGNQAPPAASEPTVLSGVAPAREFPEDFYDDARIAATEVIERYLELTDAITRGGGVDSHRIASVVSESWLPEEHAGFDYFVAEDLRSVGATVMNLPLVQSVHITPQGTLEVGVVMCVDGTNLFVIPTGYDDPPKSVLRWHPIYEDFDGDTGEWAALDRYLDQPGVTWGESTAIQAWLTGDSLRNMVIDSWQRWWGVYPC
ncbi:MAG: hypothetical protein ACJAV4_001200 [Pontimonas sp.]